MMKVLTLILSLCLSLAITTPAVAAPPTLHVAEFSVIAGEHAVRLKEALPALLSSRLAATGLKVTDSAAEATATVSGSYFQIGSSFSIDAQVKDADGSVRVRAFEQGQGDNDLLPAVTRLASKLAAQIAAFYQLPLPAPPAAAPAVSPPLSVTGAAPPASAAPVPLPTPAPGDIVRPAPPAVAATEVIPSADIVRSSPAVLPALRLTGVFNGLALGRTLPDGSRELFVSGSNVVQYYRQGRELRLVKEVTFHGDERVLAVDTYDLDRDGVPELYVTLVKGEQLASQVWLPTEKGLEQKAKDLPLYFRAIALDGRERKLYGQQMSTDDDFFGGVGEVVRSARGYELAAQFTLPRFGTLYNFNRIPGPAGKKLYVVLNDDGYLIVYAESGDEIWRSSDRFGGSATSFQRENRSSGEKLRWIFLEQRITVTPEGEIIVPRNSGTFNVGINRAYNKNSVYCLAWNGSILDEKWHTKESPSYLPDYVYIPEKKELLLLEVVKKAFLFSDGASTLTVKKVE